MPVRFLCDAQREQLSGFPADLDAEALDCFFTPPLYEWPAAVSGREPDDPWLVATVAALHDDRSWSNGGRQQLLAPRPGRGEMFHVSAVANRNSILYHGLDWRHVGAALGIAGASSPDAPAVFLCTCIEETTSSSRWPAPLTQYRRSG